MRQQVSVRKVKVEAKDPILESLLKALIGDYCETGDEYKLVKLIKKLEKKGLGEKTLVWLHEVIELSFNIGFEQGIG